MYGSLYGILKNGVIHMPMIRESMNMLQRLKSLKSNSIHPFYISLLV